MLTHRLAYAAFVGPIPEGLCVLHHCDNPPCCNTDHLYVGTQAQNSADMVARGRSPHALGEKSGKARYSDAEIELFLDDVEAGVSIERAAARRNIKPTTATGIITGARRPHQTRANLAQARGRELQQRDDAIVAAYLGGETSRMVGLRVGVHCSVVSRVLARRGIQARRGAPNRIDIDETEVRRLFGDGFGERGIADRMGVSRMPVKRVMRELGLQRPPGRVKGR